MHSTDLQSLLINHAAMYGGHLDRRPYIGLSEIGDCNRVIYDRFLNGSRSTISERLKHSFAYNVEDVLLKRLDDLGVYSKCPEITLHDGLVRGHPDGMVGGDLLEIKSIEREQWFPEPRRLPNRAFYQVQAYLHFLKLRYGHVVYVARDTGAIRVIGCTHSIEIGRRIEARLDLLVNAVRQHARPDCSCGRCK